MNSPVSRAMCAINLYELPMQSLFKNRTGAHLSGTFKSALAASGEGRVLSKSLLALQFYESIVIKIMSPLISRGHRYIEHR